MKNQSTIIAIFLIFFVTPNIIADVTVEPNSQAFCSVACSHPNSEGSLDFENDLSDECMRCCMYGTTCPASTTTAEDVSQPEPIPEPNEDPDIPWVTVVGIGVVGIGAIIGAKLLRGNKPGQVHDETSEEKKKDDKKKKNVAYILQLSTDKITVSSEKSASFMVTVWRQEDQNPPVKDPGAIVSVTVPPGSGLSVLPLTGGSPLTANVSLTGEAKNSPVPLTVSASAGGMTHTSEVIVTIEASLQRGFE